MINTVEDILKLQTKQELYEIAKKLKVRRRSACKKDELAKLLANLFLSEEYMYNFFLELDEESIKMFQDALINQILIDDKLLEKAYTFQHYGYGYLKQSNYLIISDQVKECYDKLDLDSLYDEYDKIIWLKKCLIFCCDLYGIVPDTILLDIYNNRDGKKILKEEMISIFQKHEKLYLNCLYNDGLFVDADMNFGQAMNLLGRQKGRFYYLPNDHEVEDYYKNHYFLENSSYQRLYQFAKKKLLLSDDKSKKILKILWDANSSDLDLCITIEQLIRENQFKRPEDVLSFIHYALDTYNNTRLKNYRGHTPNEMKQLLKETNATIATFGKAEEINIIRALTSVLEEKGYEAETIINMKNHFLTKKMISHKTHKIYPNDPCPCGSGLKFKKCCGR